MIKKKIKSEYKELKKSNKKLFDQNSYELVNNKKNESISNLIYINKTKFKWWTIPLIILIATISFLISSLIGYLIDHKLFKHYFEFSYFIIMLIMIFLYFLFGYLKNNSSANFYGDKRRRYEKTYSNFEIKMRLIQRNLLWPSIIDLIIILIFVLIN